jgi:hypothetical protein
MLKEEDAHDEAFLSELSTNPISNGGKAIEMRTYSWSRF